jgi:hypothetical protein
MGALNHCATGRPCFNHHHHHQYCLFIIIIILIIIIITIIVIIIIIIVVIIIIIIIIVVMPGLQFAVTVAPRSMKGIIMGLFYLFSGIGSFLGTALIVSLSSNHVWFDSTDHGNINCRSGCSGQDTGPAKNLRWV